MFLLNISSTLSRHVFSRNPLQWHHNGRDSVSNHQPHDCLLNRLFRRKSKKNQRPASLAFVRGVHRWPVNSPYKWPLTRKMFPFDDVIMHYVIIQLVRLIPDNNPANWRSRSATVRFTCARNSVFPRKINFCADVERMVCFPRVWLCVICVSFEFALGPCVFTLGLRCYWAHVELKMVSNPHAVNTKTLNTRQHQFSGRFSNFVTSIIFIAAH